MKQLSTAKKRIFSFLLTLVTVFSIIPLSNYSVANASSIYDTGFQALAWGNITVYTTSDCTTSKGTIYVVLSPSCVGKVNVTSTVYYGSSSSTYQKVGTVYANEMVTVMGKSSGWVYIEYNSASGRKRGYIPDSNITLYGNVDLNNIPVDNTYFGSRYISGSYTVYAGDTDMYPTVGSISNETVRILSYDEENLITYRSVTEIEYTVNGTSQKKTGYIFGYTY